MTGMGRLIGRRSASTGFQMKRRISTLLVLTALVAGSAGCVSAQARDRETAQVTNRAELTIERLYASPSLSGPSATGVKYSPDGRRVTFLKAREDDGSRYDLWQFDVETGEQSMLVDSSVLVPDEGELSEEEKALREKPDQIADWIIFIEAIEEEALLQIWTDNYLSEKSLIQNGASSANIGTYKLHFSLSSEDL